ncbi:DUF4082 domain-containing protein [Streptosporangium sp. NBC_01469]|uniref:DUF4082 domain-containing protein n=1 Tax=Streptosporangium sp. NBC_01469 TaxID=2903898 RepID=UPI002E2B06D1|nr:DUF4082 domain-containing protein [Streptosporangium sp. NBC_01469]
MSKPVRDALDQTAGTTAIMIDTRGARSRPLLRLRPPRPRGAAGRVLLKAAVVAALAMGAVTGTPGGASATDPVDIGDAAPFGVLAAAVTNVNSTTVTGDLGVSPGTTVTGFPPGTVSGTKHIGDATAAQAKADAAGAYADAAGRTPDATLATQLGGTSRGPGVYNSVSGGFSINGTLALDAQGDPDAVFIFQASTLDIANVGNISLQRGAQADNLFWQISGSATLGTYCTFRGNILAQGTVTIGSGANVNGRVFALNGTAAIQGTGSLPFTRVTVPNDPPTTTTLTSSADPAWRGDPVTLTAAVQQVSGTVVPAGEVVFKDGSTVLGSAFQTDGVPARITVSDLSGGDHNIVAVYLGGDTFDHEALIHFAPSTSPPVVQSMSDSLWNSAGVPAVPAQPDTQGVTLGVKFTAATSGTATGIRFYKGTQNTGTHIGSLWTSGGTLLASATFTNETATGWQEVSFSTPVAITANTTYVASYYAPAGRYATTRPYFVSAYVNGPLTALANGAGGGNGVYTYGAANAFPTSNYQSTNYWVDVVFIPTDSLWNRVAVPAVPSQPDAQGVALGVKFTAATNGKVSGIRFYKGAQNTGVHTASLWTSGGTLLASAPFTNETATGWQQVNFSQPVNVTGGTTYVASYHTTSGNYSMDRPYFTSQYVNGALTALADGAAGGNGVYTYNASNIFPTTSYQATNYWVDPIFHS